MNPEDKTYLLLSEIMKPIMAHLKTEPAGYVEVLSALAAAAGIVLEGAEGEVRAHALEFFSNSLNDCLKG